MSAGKKQRPSLLWKHKLADLQDLRDGVTALVQFMLPFHCDLFTGLARDLYKILKLIHFAVKNHQNRKNLRGGEAAVDRNLPGCYAGG